MEKKEEKEVVEYTVHLDCSKQDEGLSLLVELPYPSIRR